MKPVRVRFAPSPTGSLHIGGVRTALYNYLLAKKTGGQFLIRIEDTDQTRFVPGAEEYIFEALRWLGLQADESPEVGGPHAPYRQSERMGMYADFANQLVEQGKAYLAFDTPDDLEAARQAVPEGTFQYNAATRLSMKNSLSLSKEEVSRRLEAKEPYVIRLMVPKKEEIRLNDLIRGWVMVHSSTMDDKVLLKSDGMPTYHLANVVDDHLMEITHVIRGEEWLPSAPTHVLLYQFFGWEDTMPQFAHLPLLLKPVGDGKLSKRDGEAHGFPVFPLAWHDVEKGRTISGFREEGYLPEALLNFLALLGWNPGTEQEIFSLDELVEAFSMDRIGKSGTRFDIQKARWFNHHYLQEKPDDFFAEWVKSAVIQSGVKWNDNDLGLWVQLVKSRSTFPQDLSNEILSVAPFPTEYDPTVMAGKWNAEMHKGISVLPESLGAMENWTGENVKHQIHIALESAGFKPGKLMQLIRVAITGKGAGPDLMTLIQLLGKEETLRRLTAFLEQNPAI